MTFTELLETAQETRGLSQRRAAAMLDVTPITYKRWLTGDGHPHWANVPKLARFVGLTNIDVMVKILEDVEPNGAMGVYLSSVSRPLAA